MNKFSRPGPPSAPAPTAAPAVPPDAEPASVVEAEPVPDPRLITRFASSGG